MKKQITLLLISTCSLTFTCNIFGMEISPNQNTNHQCEKKSQQPEDLAALLKRNNELLLLSIQQNHLLAQRNDYMTQCYTSKSYCGHPIKATAIEEQLDKLYTEHNVSIGINAPSASNHSNK